MTDSQQVPTQLDVLTIGHALVDVLAGTTDEFLASQSLTPGSMNLIDELRAKSLYGAMTAATEMSGGSAANTATGVVACGGSSAFIGTVANDQLGEIFAHDTRAVGVLYRTPPISGPPATGRSMILITPDGERTMNTFLGAGAQVGLANFDKDLLEAATITYVEGYMLDTPNADKSLFAAAETVHNAGKKFSVTLSDMFCVTRHHDFFMDLLSGPVDIVFGNDEEACGLIGVSDLDEAIAQLAKRAEVVAITRGSKGSVIVRGDERIDVPAVPVTVVDTTGAGDLYAAGVLTGLAKGFDLEKCAEMGTNAAAAVITHPGARLINPL